MCFDSNSKRAGGSAGRTHASRIRWQSITFPRKSPPSRGRVVDTTRPIGESNRMRPRFAPLCTLFVGLGAAALGLPARGDDPKPATPALKLERKNFVEKTSGYKLDENTKQKLPTAAK